MKYDFILHKKSCRTEIFWTITYIQNEMQMGDNTFKIQHILRDCNAVDCALVKIVLVSGDICI